MKKIIDDCYKEAKRIVSKEKKLIDVLANALIEKETLTKEEIAALVEANSSYKVKIETKEEMVEGKPKKQNKKKDE